MKLKALIFSSLLFSTVSQAAFSDLAVLTAENDIRERVGYLFDVDAVKAMEGTEQIKKKLDKVVKSGLRANKSCLLIKNDFEKDQNAQIVEEVRIGKWTKTGTSVEELRGLNSMMADYVGARCMQVK